MNKNNIYYKPGAKMLNLSKYNKNYYEIINNIPISTDIPQEENIFYKLKQNPEIVIFMICFCLWRILAALF